MSACPFFSQVCHIDITSGFVASVNHSFDMPNFHTLSLCLQNSIIGVERNYALHPAFHSAWYLQESVKYFNNGSRTKKCSAAISTFQ